MVNDSIIVAIGTHYKLERYAEREYCCSERVSWVVRDSKTNEPLETFDTKRDAMNSYQFDKELFRNKWIPLHCG